MHENTQKLLSPKRRQKHVKNLTSDGTKNNNASSHMLPDHCYPFGLSLQPSSLKKKGTPYDLFWPALDPPLGRSGRKTTTLVRDHGYFIPSKFHQNPSSGSGEEVENVKSLRTDDGRTNDGWCATIAHSSLPLRWVKNRDETIRLPHDTIRIAIQGSRYDTYRDTHFAMKKKEHDA